MKLSEVSLETRNGEVTHAVADGVDMPHALSVTYQHIAGEVPMLTLVLPVEEMRITGAPAVEKKIDCTGEYSAVKRTIGCPLKQR